MNSNPCSKVAAILFAALVVAAVPAAGIDVSPTDPTDDAEVGSEVTVTYELTDLYTNADNWTLNATTGLDSPTWTIETLDNQGNHVSDNRTVTSANVSQEIAGETATIRVRISGTVPEIANYTYAPAESTRVVEFNHVVGNSVDQVHNDTVHPYTSASKQARSAIENASAAIDDAEGAGAGVGDAQTLLGNAKDLYEAGNFQSAITAANEAEKKARNSKQSSQQTSTLLMGAGGVVAVALLGGVAYWYRSTRDEYDELG